MSPNEVEYDGPKTFKQIVFAISLKTGIPYEVVRKCISYFLEKSLFRKFPEGQKFSLRGIGSFVPLKYTKTRIAKGQRLLKHNVNGRLISEDRGRKRMADNRFNKGRIERRKAAKANLKNGWKF